MHLKEEIETRLREEIEGLKEEVLMAKRILRDPKLSEMATIKFGELLEKKN